MTNRRWLAVASRLGAFFVACGATLSSCRKTSAVGDEGAARGDADGAVASPASEAAPRASFEAATADASTFIAATQRACRVMALRGRARALPRARLPSASSGGGAQGGGEVLARGDLVPEGRIIELEAESELTVHSTVSTREITLVGPAAAETCPGGEEAVRLARGKVTGFPGAGVRPGADVWIATPLGVVRFNDAKIAIDVPDDAAARLEVAVITGQATFVPVAGIVAPALTAGRAAPGGDPKGAPASGLTGGEPIALAPGTTFTARRPEGAISRWGSDLVAACVRDATAAQQAGERMVAPGDAGREILADLASAHVKARQRARAACEVAWAVGPLAPGLLDAARLSDLERADAMWRGAPGRSGAYQLTPLPARR